MPKATTKKSKAPKKMNTSDLKVDLGDKDYLHVNIFERYPSFSKLHVENFTVGDDLDDPQMQTNKDIILSTIKFLNKLQFEASMVNKKRLFHKFNHNFPQLVIVDQLYCILPNRSCETYIDQSVEQSITFGAIKMIDLNNENFRFRLAILYDDFIKVVNDSIEDASFRNAFINLIQDYPNMLQIDSTTLSRYKLEPKKLVQLGFLTISRGRGGFESGSSSNPNVYNVGLPNLGPFLKIVKVGIRFVSKLCQSYHQNEVLETHLIEKYTRDTLAYRRMRGLNITWMLSVMVGSGLLECYNTPVGRVYKLTGKQLY